MGELRKVEQEIAASLDSLVRVFRELDRIDAQTTCKSCAFYEAPVRGGWRHCCLNMNPLNQHDWCEEHEPRMRKTRAGQRQLPGLFKQG